MRNILVLATLVALLLGSAPALADEWVVVKLRGSAQQLIEGAWTPVARGDTIPDDRTVRTLGDGHVDLQRGAEVVTLGADTQVMIHDKEDVRYTTVEQDFGTVEVEAQVENVQHFAVETKFLAAVVKGTHFTVTSSELGASVSVARGQVEVESAASKRKTTVTIGQMASVAPGTDMVVSGGGSMPAIFGPDGRIVQPAGAPAGTPPNIAAPVTANRSGGTSPAGDAVVTTAALVNPADAALVERRLREAFPFLPAKLMTHFWAGRIAMTLDRLPHLHRRADGLCAWIGCNGRGLALACAMAPVLADALEGKGDTKSAQGYRSAVAAIRESERADELHRLGLYQRAFAGYRSALAQFSDAYCIQSRLAVQLSRLGFQDEALKHYRRAFELMPDSFGRVESHCFGCESVFAGPSAQATAEEVFTGLLKRDTTKPQAAYMLGYLRKEQARYEEAAVLFRRAIALDALYLNAWRQLNDVSDKTYIEPTERDIARLRLFELDPRQRHVRYQLTEVADLPTLWHAIARIEGQRRADAMVPQLYPLAASSRARQEALDKLPPEMRARMEQYIAVQQTMVDAARDGRPLPSLADQKLLVAALRLMGVATHGEQD